MIQDNSCNLCGNVETLDHLLFDCRKLKNILLEVLHWLNIEHQPQNWNQELKWIIHVSKSKHWRGKILKIAFREIVYE